MVGAFTIIMVLITINFRVNMGVGGNPLKFMRVRKETQKFFDIIWVFLFRG